MELPKTTNAPMRVFNNQEFGDIRTSGTADSPLFCATDVCKALGYVNSRDAVAKHVDAPDVAKRDAWVVTGKKADGSEAKRLTEVTYVTESGLYSLIFGSKLESAKRFKRWVTSDVLPTIRKTGGYQIPKTFAQALALAAQQAEIIEAQQAELTVARPKADYFDGLVERNLLTNFRDTAKQIGLGQKEFVERLLCGHFVYRDKKGKLKPYMEHVPKLFKINDWQKDEKAGSQTLITPEGKETFRLIFGKNNGLIISNE